MRKDGVRLTKIDPMRKVMLHVFKNRNDSICYSDEEVKYDKAIEYLKKVNEGRDEKITTFHLVNAALVRTIAKYPHLNRFVASKKLYARNHVSVSFVALKKINGQTIESLAKVDFELDDTIFEIAEKVNKEIDKCRTNQTKSDDKLIALFSKLPSPILSGSAYILERCSEKGLLPNKVQNDIPLFTSVFISNLGSIGHKSLHHHLYEFGNCSVFLTLGKKVKKEDGVYIDFSFSVDERVADGIELVKAFRYFKTLLEHPERLEKKPTTIVKDECI